MTDCIIVGSGVAGISAALTLQSNGKSFLIFAHKTRKISVGAIPNSRTGSCYAVGHSFPLKRTAPCVQ